MSPCNKSDAQKKCSFILSEFPYQPDLYLCQEEMMGEFEKTFCKTELLDSSRVSALLPFLNIHSKCDRSVVSSRIDEWPHAPVSFVSDCPSNPTEMLNYRDMVTGFQHLLEDGVGPGGTSSRLLRLLISA